MHWRTLALVSSGSICPAFPVRAGQGLWHPGPGRVRLSWSQAGWRTRGDWRRLCARCFQCIITAPSSFPDEKKTRTEVAHCGPAQLSLGTPELGTVSRALSLHHACRDEGSLCCALLSLCTGVDGPWTLQDGRGFDSVLLSPHCQQVFGLESQTRRFQKLLEGAGS